MGSKRRGDRRLRIHRETVRTLSSRELRGVAGGTIVILQPNLVGQPLPRSTVWSGSEVLGNCAG